MISTSTYSVVLSDGELQWLAGAFGVAKLALPALRSSYLDQGAFLRAGKESLCERQLVVAQEGGWQVQPFLAMLIHWMSAASEKWQYRQTDKNGNQSYCSFFALDKQVLLVLAANTNYRFVACSDLSSAFQEWQREISLPQTEDHDPQVVWDIAQPLAVIRTFWKDPSLAGDMAPPGFLEWSVDVESIGEWLWLIGEKMLLRISIANHRNGIWAGRYTVNCPGEFILKRISRSSLATMMGSMLVASRSEALVE